MSSPSPRFDAWMEHAIARTCSWRKWFAWHPVKVKGERVWLRYVYRRHPSEWIEVLGARRPTSLEWEYSTEEYPS